jgi:hypothetical protein
MAWLGRRGTGEHGGEGVIEMVQYQVLL